MSINCNDYNSNECKKGLELFVENDLEEMIVLACWGVYCQSGRYIEYKNKKGKIKASDEIIRAQKDVFDAMAEYTSNVKVSDVYFAGDNIYNYAYPVGEQPDEIGYLIDKQLMSFIPCYSGVKENVKRTFVALGNHDVENCDVLNKQLNYKGWENVGVYYSVNYTRKNRGVTVVVIDTNMFDDGQENCNGKPYTDIEREKQRNFIKESCDNARLRSDWIIMIGHIPAIANGHKESRIAIKNEMIYELLDINRPHLYVCGDEHNQQFIYEKKIGVSLAIIGSGGTDLDNIFYKKLDEEKDIDPIEGTCYADKVFGFLTIKFIDESEIKKESMLIGYKSVYMNEENKNNVLNNSYFARISYEGKIMETVPIDCSELFN